MRRAQERQHAELQTSDILLTCPRCGDLAERARRYCPSCWPARVRLRLSAEERRTLWGKP